MNTRSTIILDEDAHFRATCKLRAICFLLSQAKIEVSPESEDIHGLGLIVHEGLEELAEARRDDAAEVQ